MATLESGLNPQYSENASILTGNPNRVTVEVEDTDDKNFWSNLLSQICPEKELHFDPYHTILYEDGKSERTGKGKMEILKSSADFNEWHIGCVDSDYDWLLSDQTSAGKLINNNKYLLQTYSYSFENLLCIPCTLGDFCEEVAEEKVNDDLCDYMAKLSKVIYPLLVWSVYLYSKENHDFTPSDWHKVLINTNKGTGDSLATIESEVKQALEDLEKLNPSEAEEREKMKDYLLKEKGVSAEDAYLYVRGHELFDHLVYSILGPIIASLRKTHYGALASSEEKKDYHSKEKPVKDLLYRNYRYKDNISLYDKIVHDVSLIWN